MILLLTPGPGLLRCARTTPFLAVRLHHSFASTSIPSFLLVRHIHWRCFAVPSLFLFLFPRLFVVSSRRPTWNTVFRFPLRPFDDWKPNVAAAAAAGNATQNVRLINRKDHENVTSWLFMLETEKGARPITTRPMYIWKLILWRWNEDSYRCVTSIVSSWLLVYIETRWLLDAFADPVQNGQLPFTRVNSSSRLGEGQFQSHDFQILLADRSSSAICASRTHNS